MKKAPGSDDTIFARASGAGRAGVAVFRISGPGAFEMSKTLSGAGDEPKRARLRPIRDAAGDLIDEGLVILFKAPASFTGEDVCELHLHGSPAVEAALFEALAKLGARPAEAGEFTRRALLNGKMDLAEVEGLSDLIEAETTLQRKQALGQVGGGLSTVSEGWRTRLIAILAPLEADIDFPDEEDIPAAIAARAGPEIEALIGELEATLTTASKAQAIREGVRVVIIGAPNAGKSSLLNRLSGSERAIVSDQPGTTRDIIDARLDLSGALVTLFDTAGLRDATNDAIEEEGVRRARNAAEQADIRILINDVSDVSFQDSSVSRETLVSAYGLLKPGDIIAWNKSDRLAAGTSLPAGQKDGLLVSAKTGEGVEALLALLSDRVAALCGRIEGPALSRARHEAAVRDAIDHLSSALGRIAAAPELAAEDVRMAARALGRIAGAVGVEDVLDAIFSSFCIGK
ncbi:MAG: tRNA uridine-5-carboxymethylaminomethyl(34) synthesis GTPase MnmE [Parvularculaceae bacterium]